MAGNTTPAAPSRACYCRAYRVPKRHATCERCLGAQAWRMVLRESIDNCSAGQGADAMSSHPPITSRATIGDWLAHPAGGPLLRELLAQAGQDETALAPAR